MKVYRLSLPLVALPILLLAACGLSSGGSRNVPVTPRPASASINSFPVTGEAPSTVTLDSSVVAGTLYDTILALPNAPTQQACPAIAGPRYELSFFSGTQMVLSATADTSGCQSVTLGTNDERKPNAAFWQLLQADIADASAPARTRSLTVVIFALATHDRPTAATFSSVQAQTLYDTIRALPFAENGICPDIAGPHYELAFATTGRQIRATVDKSGCGSAQFQPGSPRQADAAFWQSFDELLASAEATEAIPTQLQVTTDSASSGTSSATSVRDTTLVHQIYDAVYLLQPLPATQRCPATAAARSTLSMLSAQGIELLNVVADSGGCGLVTLNGSDVRLADKAFWALLKQATGA